MEVKDNLLQLDKVVQDLNKRLDENIDRIDKLSVVYNKFSKQSANVPSQYIKGLNDLKVTLDNVTKSEIELTAAQKKSLADQRTLNASLRSDISTRKAQQQEIERTEKALSKEQAKLEASSNMYNKVQAKMNALSNEYKNLATRKELGISLTDKEAKRYDFLQGKIQTYDKTLKAVDATMGKYTRNVGNYAGAFNPLNNSINQLSREMPAFANSVQTGFMAISNNLPIFFDAMGGIIKQNKELQAQGQPTKSVFSQLAGALFSWGTALSVGVTLLTIYGKDIVEFASNLMKGSKAIDVMKESQKSMNDISTQASKNSTEEIVNMKLLLGVAKDTSLSYNERMIAVKELQSTYPAYFGNLSKEKILAGETANAERELANAILSRAKANAAVDKITENQSKIIDLELKKIELSKELSAAKILEANAQERLNKQSQFTRGEGNVFGAFSTISNRIELQNKIKKTQSEINDITKINNTLTNFALENQKKSIKLDQEEVKVKKEKIKKIKEEKVYILGTVSFLEQQINKLEELRSTTATNNNQYKEITGAIKYYQKWLDSLTNSIKNVTEAQDNFTITIPELDENIFDKIVKDKEELDNWLKDFKNGFKEDFISNSGFSKVFDLIENFDKLKTDGVATALAISEAFQQAFNTISKSSQSNFDAEYSRLEQQKNISLQFAGESATAKEEIEKQYEVRKKEIQKREAEAQKRLAIFNIAINTAQAIAATFSKAGFPAGIPLAAFMATIGAAQIAMVSSQEIPQFWKGTDNAPEGLAWTQERGAEVITDSKGNVKTYGSNKGAELTYLNKGDKVYKSHEDYINKELSKIGIQPIGQSFGNVNINGGLTKEDLTEQITRLSKTINQKENININIDKKGFKTTVNGKENLNNRLTLKGRNV